MTQALATIRLWRSRYELQLAHKTALKRSGARGWDARKDLLTAEAQVELDEKKYVYPHFSMLAVGSLMCRLATSLESKEENPADVLEATALLAEIQAALDVVSAIMLPCLRSFLICSGRRWNQIPRKLKRVQSSLVSALEQSN